MPNANTDNTVVDFYVTQLQRSLSLRLNERNKAQKYETNFDSMFVKRPGRC